MCGRYSTHRATNDLMVACAATPGTAYDWLGGYSIAPSTRAPIIREWHAEEVTTCEVDCPRWGLRSGWAKEAGRRLINACLETAATNGIFHTAFVGQRCIVPMDGYCQWETTPSGKQPHYIHGIDLLAAAGLCAARRNDDTGEWDRTHTILTREARDASGEIHDRSRPSTTGKPSATTGP